MLLGSKGDYISFRQNCSRDLSCGQIRPYLTQFGSCLFLSLSPPPLPLFICPLPSFDLKKEPRSWTHRMYRSQCRARAKRNAPESNVRFRFSCARPLALFPWKMKIKQSSVSHAYFFHSAHDTAFLKKYCYRGRSFRKTCSLCYSWKKKNRALSPSRSRCTLPRIALS